MNDHGVKPGHHAYWLDLGDQVFRKASRGNWRCLFRLRPWRGRAAIQYGKRHGPIPGRRRYLDQLSPEAFENAGIDPAW